jgi:hypothetical protein
MHICEENLGIAVRNGDFILHKVEFIFMHKQLQIQKSKIYVTARYLHLCIKVHFSDRTNIRRTQC